MTREQLIARTFVELADTLVEDFDVVDFLHQLTVRCEELLDVSDAAVFLAHPGLDLHSPAPCDAGPNLQRLLDAACEQGPALDAHHSAQTITTDTDTDTGPAARWPEFTAQLHRAGYAQATALPMRLRDDTLGSLLLLRTDTPALNAEDLSLAQALADAATIGLIQARAIREQHVVNTQLHTALQSRILIEQAKGILAVRARTTLNQAFEAMRHHARRNQLLLSHVAREVIDNHTFQPTTPPETRRRTSPAE
ncbi:ANTAR domain-containing protein [Streptomyces sp. NPDC004111]|uniref:ANTAR domain-containing protein n=1 Tax=Streptomyces sp. NPDC004111 TaxID=3364690 RepID=UPI0036CF118D